jgi:hypothetical protein
LLFFIPIHNSFVNADIIYGTPGNDSITVPAGTIYDGIFGYEGDDTIFIESGAEVASDDQLAAESIATADAIAIDAGSGDDQVTNNGTISANADADALPADGSPSQATANANGISAGDGADMVQNAWTIAATVTSNSESGSISLTLEGNNQSQTMTTSTAIATGISGSNGGDEIITREGTITINATGDVDSTDALVTIGVVNESLLAGSSLSDASVRTNAKATGISGGEGDDRIVNDETEISVDANADAAAVGVSLMISGNLEGDIEGKALSDSNATADAAATGIDGGAGNDTIENRGKIFANADSIVTAAEVAANIEVTNQGSVKGAAMSDASVTANAAATGIDGGEGGDSIDNRGDIEFLANSDATGVSVALDVAGTMKGDAEGLSVSDSRTAAQASAIGITGGEGDDIITNDGLATTTNATASATGVSVGLTVSGSMEGNVGGKALSDANVMANATATGIDGGSGQDTIDNWSRLSSQVDASATGVAASLQVGFTKEGDVAPEALAEGSALSDASVMASAASTGIDGGAGGDSIDNRGDIEFLANSSATGVSVALDVAGTMEGNAAGSSVSDSSTTAQAVVVMPASRLRHQPLGSTVVRAMTPLSTMG